MHNPQYSSKLNVTVVGQANSGLLLRLAKIKRNSRDPNKTDTVISGL